MVIWMAEKPLEAGRNYLIKHTANTVKASCAEMFYRVDPNTLRREAADQLGLNDIGRVRFTLFRPAHVDEYRRNRATGSFILIDPLTNVTVGAGMITERLSAGLESNDVAKQPASREITWHQGRVSPVQRANLLRQDPSVYAGVRAGAPIDRARPRLLRAGRGQHPPRAQPRSRILAA
jgi:hypothetical protein